MGKEEKKKYAGCRQLVSDIKAEGKLLTINEKAMEKVRLKRICKCPHHNENGQIALNGGKWKENPYTKGKMLQCTVCGGYVDVSRITEEDFNKALDTFNRLLHVSKARLNAQTDREKEILEKITKLQYRLNTLAPDLFTMATKESKKKKNKGNNGPSVGIGRNVY